VPRLANPLVADLLEIADGLAQQSGRPNLRQAAIRKAVSTAYYAVFHALCTICSDGLVRWSRTELVAKTYRALDHGTARKRLSALASQPGASADLKRICVTFGELQDKRNDADYERSRSLFNKNEALTEIRKARETVELLGRFDEDARRRLAIDLLVAKGR